MKAISLYKGILRQQSVHLEVTPFLLTSPFLTLTLKALPQKCVNKPSASEILVYTNYMWHTVIYMTLNFIFFFINRIKTEVLVTSLQHYIF